MTGFDCRCERWDFTSGDCILGLSEGLRGFSGIEGCHNKLEPKYEHQEVMSFILLPKSDCGEISVLGLTD